MLQNTRVDHLKSDNYVMVINLKVIYENGAMVSVNFGFWTGARKCVCTFNGNKWKYSGNVEMHIDSL